MTNIVQFKRVGKLVEGLYPQLWPASLVEPSTHLQCGACGFNGRPEWFIYSEGEDALQPVCNCPLPAILDA